MEGRKQLVALLACCIATLMIPCAAWAKIIYVDDDANAPGNGLSWQTAYKYLQDGLADAQTVDKPVEIRVAQGVYKPDRDAAHPRGGVWSPWTFELHGGRSLRGGFAGMAAPDPNEQDANSYETTLTGDLADNDADLRETFEYEWPWDEPTHQDNVITVVEISGPGAVLLEGFTVTGGFNSSWGMIASGLPYGECGGGVLVYNEADAVIRNCHITRNYAEEIGGVAVAFAHSARLENCVITSNMVEFDGGGMCWMEVARVELMGCTFTGNWAGKGGAVGAYNDVFEEPYGCSACVSRCIFAANMAYSYAAGLLVCSSSGAIATEVTNCIVEGNWILNPGAGAGVRAEGDAKVVLRNCIIRHNNRLDRYSLRWPRDLGGDGTLDVAYCNVLGGWPGEGNIDADALYARPGYWDPNGSWEGRANAFWVPGDYHLRSRAGRWDPVSQSRVTDEITSPCIDAGDPNMPIGDEPQPHGGRVNMGAYGGTACASKSPSGTRVNYVGSGTPNDPYLIYTPERLRELAVRPQEWDKHFRLMADIGMGGDQACQKNTIGVDTFMPFSGVFDGNGHTISGFLKDKKYLIHDRDPLFMEEFREVLKASGIKPIRTLPMAPHWSCIVERFIRSIKSACLDRMLIFGARHLEYVIKEYMAHYHTERAHQGIGNEIIELPPPGKGEVVCQKRLGGLLNFYRRAA
jgi:hypothetical protein